MENSLQTYLPCAQYNFKYLKVSLDIFVYYWFVFLIKQIKIIVLGTSVIM